MSVLLIKSTMIKLIRRESNNFLRNQEKVTSNPKKLKKLRRESQFDCETPMIIKNYVRKQFAEIVSCELEERIAQMICGRRSSHVVEIAEMLLEQLAVITGEKCTLQTPRTGTQRILVFLADQVAVWLTDTVENADRSLADSYEQKLNGLGDEGGKGDGMEDQEDDDDDLEIIKRRKKPRGISRSFKDGGGDAAEKKLKEKRERPKQLRESAGKNQEKPKQGVLKEKGGVGIKKESEAEGGGAGQAETDSSAGKGKSDNGTRGASERRANHRAKSTTGESVKDDMKKKGGASAQSKGSIVNKEGQRQRTSIAPSKLSHSLPKAKPVESRPSARGSKAGGSSQEGKEVTATTPKRGSQSRIPPHRQQTSSELKKDRVQEIVSQHLSRMIQKEGSNKNTPRQEALQDIISKKLEGSVIHMDQATIEAIRVASRIVASYIDEQVAKAEMEYGCSTPASNKIPVAQRPKGPVFSVRKQQSSMLVRQITHTETKAKVDSSRGKMPLGSIALAEGPFDTKETKDWTKWATNVVSMADKWSRWIDSTVTQAVIASEKRKAGEVVPAWRSWRATTGDEALEWRRNKKLLDRQAALFLDKAKQTSAPSMHR